MALPVAQGRVSTITVVGEGARPASWGGWDRGGPEKGAFLGWAAWDEFLLYGAGQWRDCPYPRLGKIQRGHSQPWDGDLRVLPRVALLEAALSNAQGLAIAVAAGSAAGPGSLQHSHLGDILGPQVPLCMVRRAGGLGGGGGLSGPRTCCSVRSVRPRGVVVVDRLWDTGGGLGDARGPATLGATQRVTPRAHYGAAAATSCQATAAAGGPQACSTCPHVVPLVLDRGCQCWGTQRERESLTALQNLKTFFAFCIPVHHAIVHIIVCFKHLFSQNVDTFYGADDYTGRQMKH